MIIRLHRWSEARLLEMDMIIRLEDSPRLIQLVTEGNPSLVGSTGLMIMTGKCILAMSARH